MSRRYEQPRHQCQLKNIEESFVENTSRMADGLESAMRGTVFTWEDMLRDAQDRASAVASPIMDFAMIGIAAVGLEFERRKASKQL
jgi:hypothetical protein